MMTGYEGLEMDALVTLETALSKALKVEKSVQGKKDINYELKRIRKAMGKGDICI